MKSRRPGVVAALIAGMLTGALLYHAAIMIGGATIVSLQTLRDQTEVIRSLEDDNRLLSDDLFGRKENASDGTGDELIRPYSDEAEASSEVAAARSAAVLYNKFLMITFGANWCIDCRTLYKMLHNGDVAEYARDRFIFINVNVGEFNRNLDVASALGVSLERGIPVAIFYDPSGAVIGTTNNGELEPARLYTSNQILKFIRDIAERSLILPPDSISSR